MQYSITKQTKIKIEMISVIELRIILRTFLLINFKFNSRIDLQIYQIFWYCNIVSFS